jgi:hypothetical protein
VAPYTVNVTVTDKDNGTGSASFSVTVVGQYSRFSGSVKVNGTNVPLDAVVSAWINGVKYAEGGVELSNGETKYDLIVPGDSLGTPEIEGGKEGDTIEFYIGFQKADQTGIWHNGADTTLDLTAPYDTFLFLPLLDR